MRYSLFKLLYGCHPGRGGGEMFLDVLREEWESQIADPISPSAYLIVLQGEIKATTQLAQKSPRRTAVAMI